MIHMYLTDFNFLTILFILILGVLVFHLNVFIYITCVPGI